MALPTSTTPFLNQAYIQVIGQAAGTKGQAQEALAALQSGPVSATWIFSFLDAVRDAIQRFDRFKTVTGLDAYAQQQTPGYTGSMVADIATTRAALQDCLDWVVTNFPKDSTNTWILSQQLNVDGTRTLRNFTTIQTAGLQTKLQTLIATIG